MIKFKQYITEVIHGHSVLDDSAHADTLHDILGEHYTEKIKNNQNHHTSANSYTETAYHPINIYLNHGKTPALEFLKQEHGIENNEKMADDLLSAHISHIPHLDSVTTSHEAPDDLYVYSGIKFDPSEGKEHKEPFKAHIKQFTSATINAEKARLFAKTHVKGNDLTKHYLKIHIPKGSKHGAYVGEISRHPHEQEFLLKRNLKLKIHHVPEIQNAFQNRINHIWHATIEE